MSQSAAALRSVAARGGWHNGGVSHAPMSEPTIGLLAALRRAGLTDVSDADVTRAVYSSDASLYRVVPQVVVRPRHPTRSWRRSAWRGRPAWA